MVDACARWDIQAIHVNPALQTVVMLDVLKNSNVLTVKQESLANAVTKHVPLTACTKYVIKMDPVLVNQDLMDMVVVLRTVMKAVMNLMSVMNVKLAIMVETVLKHVHQTVKRPALK